MNSQLAALMDHLARMASVLPTETMESLSKAASTLSGAASAPQLFKFATTPTSEALYRELVLLWQTVPEVASNELSYAIISAQRCASMLSQVQAIEPVWTGPATSVVPVRRTEQVLLDIIAAAEKELLIVTYASQSLDPIVAALGMALERGVTVRLLFELAEESEGKIRFDAADTIQGVLPKIAIFYWPIENREQDSRGRYGVLHAKCAVADKKVALVSSANLTASALELNMEMGLLVRGGEIPAKIANHFEELIRRKVFERRRT